MHCVERGLAGPIEERPIAHSSGLPADCIVLDSDGADEWVEHAGVEDYRTLEKTERIELLPAREFPTDKDAIRRFRERYREHIADMIEALDPIAQRLGYEPA